MAGVVWYLFSAGGAVSCLLACTGWVTASRGSTASRCALLATAVFFALASMSGISGPLSQLLSYGYQPLTRNAVPPGSVSVVVLGSGSIEVRDWAEQSHIVPDPLSTSRLLEAARVFTLLDATQLISSGGAASPRDRFRPAGQVMAAALKGLGVPADRIRVETSSTNTHDEAVIVERMLAQRPTDHVVLVTSRVHMRRAAAVFRAAGVDVIPAIARDPGDGDTVWERLRPSDTGLREAALTAHEVLGLAAYGLRGWSRF